MKNAKLVLGVAAALLAVGGLLAVLPQGTAYGLAIILVGIAVFL